MGSSTALSEEPLVPPPRQKRKSLSRQTKIDNMSTDAESKPHETSIDEPVKSTHETNIDEPLTQETTIDDELSKETVFDKPASKETMIDKQIGLAVQKNHDASADSISSRSVDASISSMEEDGQTNNNDVNAEKTNDDSMSDLQHMKTEKWESELKEKDALGDLNDNRLHVEEKHTSEGTKEVKSELIITNATESNNVHVMKEPSVSKSEENEDDDGLNPFGDDDFEEEEEVQKETKLVANEDEEMKNKKNEEEVDDNKIAGVIAPSVDDNKIADEIADTSNPFGDDEDKEEVETVQEAKRSGDDVPTENSTSDVVITTEISGDAAEAKETSGDAASATETSGHVAAAAAIESPVMERLKVQTKELGDAAKSGGSIDDIYDNDLNPFGEDEEGEEDGGATRGGKDYNPFDESGSEEDDDEYDEGLNPFGDDDEEEAVPSSGRVNPFTGSPTDATPPVSFGGAMRQRAYTEKPNRPPPPRATQDQSSMYQVKTRQQILNEMHVNRNTIKKKRPAPRRPPPPGGANANTPSPSREGGIVAPPRRRTTKKAPAPPTPKSSLTPKSSRPTPSPRLSMIMTENGTAESVSPGASPKQTKPRLVVTTSDADSDGASPRLSNRRATCATPLRSKVSMVK